MSKAETQVPKLITSRSCSLQESAQLITTGTGSAHRGVYRSPYQVFYNGSPVPGFRTLWPVSCVMIALWRKQTYPLQCAPIVISISRVYDFRCRAAHCSPGIALVAAILTSCQLQASQNGRRTRDPSFSAQREITQRSRLFLIPCS